MTNPLSRVNMKNLSDFKPIVTARVTDKAKPTDSQDIIRDSSEESLLRDLIHGEKEVVSGMKRAVTLEELAERMKK